METKYYRVPIFMTDSRYDEISQRIRASFPNSCILFIDEVVNEHLQNKYNDQLTKIKTLRGEDQVQEMLLFHGTSAENIDSIGYYGFDTSRNTTSAFGRGTYFAKNASYSNHYMKSTDSKGISYMILANVIIGKCILGKNTNYHKEKNKYDNFVDNIITPSIYVTPYDNGAYPKYIIAFHKNAKK